MTGWLLIISLLLLGGVISTFGDRLGSRVGKARLTIFNLRPRSTAVLITVLTGSLISSLSFGLMLLVSRQLRVGLFQLDKLQAKIKLAEKDLKQRENKLIALRRGELVLSSGQSLATVTFRLDNPSQSRAVIDRLLQRANVEAFAKVLPGEKPNRQILLVPRADIKRLEEIIREEGTWVVNIRSAANVLLGENLVYAFPDVRKNKTVVRQGEVLANAFLSSNERSLQQIRTRVKLLLASTLAEVKRRGSISSGLQFDPNAINELGKKLIEKKSNKLEIQAVAMRNSDIADSVAVVLKLKEDN